MKGSLFLALKRKLVLSFLTLIIGFLFVVASITFFTQGLIEDKYYCDVEAKVTNIVSNDTERYISIIYTVEGVDYENHYPFWDASLDNGDIVTIKYNPDDPNEINARKKGYVYTFIICFIGGVFAFTCNLIYLIKYFKEVKRINKLIKSGKKVEAVIVCVEENTKDMSYGIAPLVITVEYDDEYRSHILNSNNIYIDANLSFYSGKKIDVYYESDKNYFIDYRFIDYRTLEK